MGKGYILQNGELEVQDYSTDGSQEVLWCPSCQEKTWHCFTAMSSTRGRLWTCLKCQEEHEA